MAWKLLADGVISFETAWAIIWFIPLVVLLLGITWLHFDLKRIDSE